MCKQQWVAIIDDDEAIRTSIARMPRCVGIQASSFVSGQRHKRIESTRGAPSRIFMTAQAILPCPRAVSPVRP